MSFNVNWGSQKLVDIADITMGQSPKSEFYNSIGEGIPFMQGRTTFGDKYHKIDTWCTEPKRFAQKGDVLMSVRAPVGDLNIAITELCIGRGLSSLKMKNGNNEYLYYLLKCSKDKLTSRETGTIFGSINKNDFATLEFKIPPRNEQITIANILSSLDEKIETNNQINKKLEEMAQTIFKQWFVDFEFPNENGEPYRSSGGEMVESDLGLIPAGWNIGCIGDYVKVKSGYAFKSAWWEESGIPVLKIKDIENNTINLNDMSYVSPDKEELAKDFLVQGGDLVITMTGATIGKFGIVPELENIMLVNQRVGKFFLGDKPFAKLGFIYCVIKQQKIYDEIVNRGSGSAQPNISPTGIETIKIILPSVQLIEKFNVLVMGFFKQVAGSRHQNTKLESLRDTLLPKLMSGEIRVPIES